MRAGARGTRDAGRGADGAPGASGRAHRDPRRDGGTEGARARGGRGAGRSSLGPGTMEPQRTLRTGPGGTGAVAGVASPEAVRPAEAQRQRRGRGAAAASQMGQAETAVPASLAPAPRPRGAGGGRARQRRVLPDGGGTGAEPAPARRRGLGRAPAHGTPGSGPLLRPRVSLSPVSRTCFSLPGPWFRSSVPGPERTPRFTTELDETYLVHRETRSHRDFTRHSCPYYRRPTLAVPTVHDPRSLSEGKGLLRWETWVVGEGRGWRRRATPHGEPPRKLGTRRSSTTEPLPPPFPCEKSQRDTTLNPSTPRVQSLSPSSPKPGDPGGLVPWDLRSTHVDRSLFPDPPPDTRPVVRIRDTGHERGVVRHGPADPLSTKDLGPRTHTDHVSTVGVTIPDSRTETKGPGKIFVSSLFVYGRL